MFRYIAVIPDGTVPRASETLTLIKRRIETLPGHWACVFDSDGLQVYCADRRSGVLDARVLGNNNGIVLGPLFERHAECADDSICAPAMLDKWQSDAITQSRGRRLITNYWGNYVAILNDPISKVKLIIKDPSGSLPCMCVRVCDITLIFSCIADCVGLNLLRFTPNWKYITARVLRPGIPCTAAALTEVTEVHRGECLQINPHKDGALQRQQYWMPADFCDGSHIILDRARAAEALVATVVSSIQTLASCHSSLLLRLSGGLDSSIVLGCLKDAPSKPRITCCTYNTPSARANARPWAQIAAESAACELVERILDPRAVDLRKMLTAQPTARPSWIIGDMQIAPIELPLAAEVGASAVFTGHGGDCGLGSLSIDCSLSEYVRHRGIDRGFLQVALQVASCRDLSIWQVLARTIHDWASGGRSFEARRAARHASRLTTVAPGIDLEEANGIFEHPWFKVRRPASPAIVNQLGDLTSAPKFYTAFIDPALPSPERVDPFYSQPVVELLLRIPPFLQIDGGRNRGLARQAFAGRVPKVLLDRVWKDRAPQGLSTIVNNNRKFIREQLLDGILAGRGLLNRRALEAALSDAPSSVQHPEGEIMSHLDVEVWLHHWMTAPTASAAA